LVTKLLLFQHVILECSQLLRDLYPHLFLGLVDARSADQRQLQTSFALAGVTGIIYYDSKLDCWPMPNVMAALPNIGGALCSTPQSLAEAHY